LLTESNLKRAKQQVVESFEREFIRHHWAAHDWHIGRTAEAIGQSREWLGKQIRKYGLARETESTPD
jgi:DNA-binding NtrC family response regulator